MNLNLNVKPVNFKFNQYLTEGYEFLKKEFVNVLVAMLLTILMSIIPFCGLLAMGNFYKYMRKLNKGEAAGPGEIFNFDDFMPYFILQLIMFAGIIVLYIPIIVLMPATIYMSQDGGAATGAGIGILMMLYFVLFFAVVIYFAVKAYYIIPLIAFKGVKEIQTAWKMSSVMTKGNMLNIFLFSLVVSLIGNLGIIACGIGLLLTLPFVYTAQYFSYQDAMNQIEYDEITEIGIKDKY